MPGESHPHIPAVFPQRHLCDNHRRPHNARWMSFDVQARGSLEVGKFADMVILSGNPYETETSKLDTIRVEWVLLQGGSYQKIGQNPVGQVFKSIFRN